MELHDHVHASTLLIDICLAPVQHLQLLGREQSLIHAYQCVHHVPACVSTMLGVHVDRRLMGVSGGC